MGDELNLESEQVYTAQDEFDEDEMFPEKFYYPSLERLRIILMGFMCINLFTIPSTGVWSYIQTICGFAPIAFFILSGYLVLRDDEEDKLERIKRAIKRTAFAFFTMAAVYVAMNLIYYQVNGIDIMPLLIRKRFWFNMIVLDVWQFKIGGLIWYVQSLLYAYIVVYFLEKLRILKLDWLIFIILFAVALLCGELCGVIKWKILGYSFLPGNFFNRALPYVILGRFISRRMDLFAVIPRAIYWLGIPFGVFLCVFEILLFETSEVSGYYGHLIGMAVIAFSACLLAIQNDIEIEGFEAWLGLTRGYTNIIYYICQPVSLVLGVVIVKLLGRFDKELMTITLSFLGVITFAVCLLIVLLIARIGRRKTSVSNDEQEN